MDETYLNHLKDEKASKERLLEKARKGQFSIGAAANARTPENIAEQVRLLQSEIDQLDEDIKGFVER